MGIAITVANRQAHIINQSQSTRIMRSLPRRKAIIRDRHHKTALMFEERLGWVGRVPHPPFESTAIDDVTITTVWLSTDLMKTLNRISQAKHLVPTVVTQRSNRTKQRAYIDEIEE